MVYYGKNCEKTIVQLNFTENYGISIYEGKKMVKYQKLRNFYLRMEKNHGNIQNNWSIEVWFAMEKLLYYGKKIWYYTENYGTLIYHGKAIYIYGTMEKTMVL